MSELREWFAANEEETIRVGAGLARLLRPPVLVLLSGPLGAGKTTLMKGIVETLGAGTKEDVTSPTFTLVNEYRSTSAEIFHLDVYRLETEAELQGLGLDEMLSTPNAFVFVEWGEKFSSLRELAGFDVSLGAEKSGRKIALKNYFAA